MARLTQIVVDSIHPAALARFWAAALDDFETREYDAEEIARLASLGFTPETDPVVIVDGPTLELCFQQVDVPADAKLPLHLDLTVTTDTTDTTAGTDRPGEVARLVALGASVRQEFDRHTWMLDPEGNDFCLTDSR